MGSVLDVKVNGPVSEETKKRLVAFIDVNTSLFESFRLILGVKKFTEVSGQLLQEVSGYEQGPPGFIVSQSDGMYYSPHNSAQMQLEAMVLALEKGFFTVESRFREISAAMQEKLDTYLEHSSIEALTTFRDLPYDMAFDQLICLIEEVIKFSTREVLENYHRQMFLLGADLNQLCRILRRPFVRITYQEALDLLSYSQEREYKSGFVLGAREAKEILAAFYNTPTFVTYTPARRRPFYFKRTDNHRIAYSVDLLLPKAGNTVGGALHEEDGSKVKAQFRQSRIGYYSEESVADSLGPFRSYFRLFSGQAPLLRGGFGINYEKFIGFLLSSRIFG